MSRALFLRCAAFGMRTAYRRAGCGGCLPRTLAQTLSGALSKTTGHRLLKSSIRYRGERVRYFDRPGAVPQIVVSHGLKDGDRLFAADYRGVRPKRWPGLRLSDLYD